MKRLIVRAAAFIMTILLASAPAVFADLERGDRGDEVYDLQQLLFETGWLFESPDGVFGKNTEAAVKGFEEYASLPVDGIADDQMIYELAVSLDVLNEELGIVSEAFGENAVGYFTATSDEGYMEGDSGMEFAECCVQWTDVDGSSRTDYCEKHHNLHVDTYDMLTYGDLASACMASDMWYEEVNKLYEQWAALLPVEKQGGVLANRATFLASVESQRVAAGFGDETESSIIKTEVGVCQTLRNQAAWLCGMIWDQQNGGLVSEDGASQDAVVLNDSVIIDGQTIYYAGNIEGEGYGVYAMYSDGSDRFKLSDIQATLKAASNGNLLVWHYDDDGYAAMEVLRMDGSLETVGYGNAHAIAKEGRFYFGGSSVAEDGSDHQWMLSSDPELHDNYYPIDVVDGYLYYLDANDGSVAEAESSAIPWGDVELNRLNLETGEIELLSGAGTCYIGIEDGMLYYTREDFDIYDNNSGGTFTVEVDEGLYSMNLEALAETQLVEFSEDPLIFEFYTFIEDGVIYGVFSDCNPDEPVYTILSRQVNGHELPALEMDGNEVSILSVHDGVLYGLMREFIETDESYTCYEYIVMYDLHTGAQMRFALEEGEILCYTAMHPRIAVENGRIFYYVRDEDTGAESLQSVALNGDDLKILVKSEPLY